MEQPNTTSYDYGRWSSDLTQVLGSYRTPQFHIHPKNATLFLKRWVNGMPEWRSRFVDTVLGHDEFKKAIVHAIDCHATPARAKDAVLDNLRELHAIEDNDGSIFVSVKEEPITIVIHQYYLSINSEEMEIRFHIVNGTLPIPSTLTVEAVAAYNRARNGGK